MDHFNDMLNELIETCKDGEYGFRSCAEHGRRIELRQLFANRAEDCRRSAAELQGLVQRYGGRAEDSGTVRAAVHRGWVAVKGQLAGFNDVALLEECERGEDVALACYRKAMMQALPGPVLMVVQAQYEGVKRNHAQIRRLRDDARTTHV